MMLEARKLSLENRLAEASAVFRPGEISAICGPNGAGKSTLLSCLAGLLHAQEGDVVLDDSPLGAMPARERARAIGYLPQSPDVAWDVSVETLVSLGRLPWSGAPAGETQAAIDDALAALDLEPFRQRPISKLSGGERARALMARVLATRPRWLLADEPLANLDLAHAAALIARFREQARQGRGVILVMHDLAAAMNHADRVIVLNGGVVAADGIPGEALAQEVIERVWGVRAQWIGSAGAKALCL